MSITRRELFGVTAQAAQPRSGSYPAYRPFRLLRELIRYFLLGTLALMTFVLLIDVVSLHVAFNMNGNRGYRVRRFG